PARSPRFATLDSGHDALRLRRGKPRPAGKNKPSAGRGAYAIRTLSDLCRQSLLRPALFLADHLVLQRKRADCGIASPVIAALCGQNANRQSEHERGGGDDYAFGHHGSPLSFYVHVASIAVYSTAACDGRHRFGEYTVEHAEHVSIVIAKNYSRRANLARLVPWDRSLGVTPVAAPV